MGRKEERTVFGIAGSEVEGASEQERETERRAHDSSDDRKAVMALIGPKGQ